jgi:DNA polymerase III epsilon subunit-like protein
MFLDLETTGYFNKYAEITEIAAVVPILHKIDCEFYHQSEQGKFLIFDSLVKTKRKIGKKVEELNGITNELLKTEADFSAVSRDFYQFLDFVKTSSPNGKIAMISHNGFMFDYKFLFNQITLVSNLENITFFDSLDYFKKKKKWEQVGVLQIEVSPKDGVCSEQTNHSVTCDLKEPLQDKKFNIDSNYPINPVKKQKRNPFSSPSTEEEYPLSSLSLKNLYQLYFGKGFDDHHRAKQDAIALTEVVLKTHDLRMDHWESKNANHIYVKQSYFKKEPMSVNNRTNP